MIRKIKWFNSPVLGNLELNFIKDDGEIYNTIVIVGINGSGKTRVLEDLATFLNLGSFEPFDFIEYEINNNIYKTNRGDMPEDNIKIGYHNRLDILNNVDNPIYTNSSNNIKNDSLDIRHHGCIYSKARTGFNTQPIKSTTTQQIDNEIYQNDYMDDYTQIKQLLVDIDLQDSIDYRNKNELMENEGLDPLFVSEYSPQSKIFRFKQAFNNFFESMKFDGVNNNSNEMKIMFSKNNIEISADDLSTGEKQIVFRGSYLLKNSGILDNGLVLIDEPELSMHPKWQEKILDFYRGLFTTNDIQKSQIIFASHSEYLIESALNKKDDILIIELKNNNGVIDSKRITSSFILPTITLAETNYFVFDIISNDYHIELYGCLQNKIGITSVKKCDDHILGNSNFIASDHEKVSSYETKTYNTLPTYIRNAIDHPSTTGSFTKEELRTSIELLIELCR